jgi:hypothetical protein
VGDMLGQATQDPDTHHLGHTDAPRQGLTLEFSDYTVRQRIKPSSFDWAKCEGVS